MWETWHCIHRRIEYKMYRTNRHADEQCKAIHDMTWFESPVSSEWRGCVSLRCNHCYNHTYILGAAKQGQLAYIKGRRRHSKCVKHGSKDSDRTRQGSYYKRFNSFIQKRCFFGLGDLQNDFMLVLHFSIGENGEEEENLALITTILCDISTSITLCISFVSL